MSRTLHCLTTVVAATVAFTTAFGGWLESVQAGWMDPPGATTGATVDDAHMYLNTTTPANGNWASGIIDDDLSTMPALTGDLTLYFDANHTTGALADWSPTEGALDEFILTLKSTGGANTINMGGEIEVNANQNRRVVVGSLTVGEELTLDLGDVSRNFKIGGGSTSNIDSLTIVNPLADAGAGFTVTNGGSLILVADNSTSLSGTISAVGILVIEHEDSFGTAAVELGAGGGRVNMDALAASFDVDNNLTVTGNTNFLTYAADGTYSGDVTVNGGELRVSGNSGDDLTISGDVSVAAGATMRIDGSSPDIILTGDAGLLAGQFNTNNGNDRIRLGIGGGTPDAAFLTLDINDNTGEFGRFTGGGQLNIDNAVLDLDTTDVTGMSQTWTLVEGGVSNASTYAGLTDLRLDGVSFLDGGTTWTASNGLGNWTFTEGGDGEPGILELEFILPSSSPEPSSFVLMALAAFGLSLTRRRRVR